NGAFYKRSDRFEQGETKGKEVRVMQVGFQYYFVPNKVNAEGSRTVKGDMITVQNGKAVQVYKAKAFVIIVVFPVLSVLIFSMIAASVRASTADKESSKIKISGF
ncbi:hypothetical protein FO498_26240, partial [Bacillus cereus]|nr:hypothetical protein [Bacillus cereus]